MKLQNYLNSIIAVSVVLIFLSFNITAQDKIKISKDSLQLFSYSTISDLNQQLDDIFNDNSFRNANWGVVIQSLDNGEYFYKRNEDKFFFFFFNLK